MATTVSFNGTSYSIPANREARGWGTQLSLFLNDVGNSALSKAGGTFTLTADANFGTSFGLIAKYIKSTGSNLAAAGVIRLANTETVSWRNAANSADLPLTASASDRLQFNAVNVPTISSTDTLTNKTLTSPTITGTGAIAGIFTGNLTGDVTGNVSGTAANVTGTVAVNKGGTGQITANAGLNALLPAQTGNANKVLTTDATNTSWTAVATTVTTTRGDTIKRGISADERLAIGVTGTVLKSNGTDPAWAAIVNADVDAAAAIAGSKIAPAFTAAISGTNGTTIGTTNGDLVMGAALNVSKILSAGLTSVGAAVFGTAQSKALAPSDATDWSVTATSFATTGGAALCFATNTLANNSVLFVKYTASLAVTIIWQTGTLYEASASLNLVPAAGKIGIDGFASQTAVRFRNSSSGPNAGMYVSALTNGV